jgi:CheY-like chemotaxis protein
MPGLRILLAEDNAANQDLAVRRLARAGHQVTVAPNGCVALDLLERERFDLMLLDVQMPVLDGLTTAAAVRRHEKLTGGHLPIIALTASDSAGDADRCAAAGMDACAFKPIDWPHLFQLIDVVVAGARAPAGPAAPQTPAPTESEVLNQAGLQQNFGDDPTLFHQIVTLFRSEKSRRLAEIQQALATADALRVERSSHSLRGALGTLCALRAMHAAGVVEAAARADHLDAAARAYDVLVAEVEAVMLELERLV